MSTKPSLTKRTSPGVKSGGRIAWLDAARAVAILCVLLCHSIETAYDFTIEEWRDAGVISKAFRLCGFSLGRLGVPLFLFLTGWLVLSKDFSREGSIGEFYRRRLPPLVCATFFWNAVYFFFLNAYNGIEPNWLKFRRLFMFGPAPFSHMWYMPLIIGMYVALPFVSRALRGLKLRDTVLPLVLCGLAAFIMPFANLVIEVNGSKVPALTTNLSTSFLGGLYGFYLVLGWLLSRADTKRIPTWWLAASFVLSFAAVCGFQTALWRNQYNYTLWYDLPLLPVCGVSLFLLLQRADSTAFLRRAGGFFRFFSENSLAVFFLHRPLQMLLFLPFDGGDVKKPIVAGVLLVGSFAASFLLAALLRNVGFLRKWIFGGK